MKPVYRLASVTVSHETVTALEALLAAARAGHVQGIVYGAILQGRKVVLNTTGEAHRSPIFTLGIISLLSADVLDQARDGPDS